MNKKHLGIKIYKFFEHFFIFFYIFTIFFINVQVDEFYNEEK